MNERSDGTRGLPPLTPDDVPAPSRWSCMTCGRVTTPGIQPVEHLLGGWVRVHCWYCAHITVQRPATRTEQEQP